MSIGMILFIILAVVFVVAYARSLSPAMRKQQADLATGAATVGIFAAAKVAKEVVTVAAKAGAVIGNEVQLSHKETLNEMDTKFNAKLAEHGGSRKRYGIAIGESINDTLMVAPASKNLSETLALQKDRAAKLEELYAKQKS